MLSAFFTLFMWLEIPSEKSMAPHSSTLAGKIHWMETVGLQSMGSLSRKQLSNFTFHFPALEKEIATHSSVLAWRIPGRGEPGGLLSMGSHRVSKDWSDLAAAARFLLTQHLHANNTTNHQSLLLVPKILSYFLLNWTDKTT